MNLDHGVAEGALVVAVDADVDDVTAVVTVAVAAVDVLAISDAVCCC